MLRLEIRYVIHVLVDDDPAVGRAIMRRDFGRRVRRDEMVAVVGGVRCREGFGTERRGDGSSVCHPASLLFFFRLCYCVLGFFCRKGSVELEGTAYL